MLGTNAFCAGDECFSAGDEHIENAHSNWFDSVVFFVKCQCPKVPERNICPGFYSRVESTMLVATMCTYCYGWDAVLDESLVWGKKPMNEQCRFTIAANKSGTIMEGKYRYLLS